VSGTVGTGIQECRHCPGPAVQARPRAAGLLSMATQRTLVIGIINTRGWFDRRSRKERRSGIDMRSDDEKAKFGERRSGVAGSMVLLRERLARRGRVAYSGPHGRV
jgi:hypothetical protein